MLTGTPLMVLKRRVAIRVLLCALGAPVVLGLLAAAVVATLEEKPEPVLAVVFGVLAIGLGCLFVWLFRREATRVTRSRVPSLTNARWTSRKTSRACRGFGVSLSRPWWSSTR